ncbi:patatin-like phospholipase family protein [Pyxidicoccus parkwayensis]|uniref:Patatin-like phospholipase family protein n=1 Tax=Pyxidicoccus parkwayensis TaxID=2813578 RepID=A0ABX7NSV9_9BACT|nr:patatin-like phospholipase family protein [Pyxidicoccus parkwaysis]QSQ21553.1 patatin-like phospholipase family protein [Pyxidicoccus parkwaysis]
MLESSSNESCPQPVDRAHLNDKPDQACDLIMKGGVTSGVVYPPAILGLAGKYRFHSIGGASAGAIAAAAAAAAEYGRQTVTTPRAQSHGFVRLAEMNAELTTPGFVRDLFKPTDACRPLFKAMLTWQEGSAKERKRAEEKEQRERDKATEQGLPPPGTPAPPGWFSRQLHRARQVLRANSVCMKTVTGSYLLGGVLGLLLAAVLVSGSVLWALAWLQTGAGVYRALGGVIVLLALGICCVSTVLGGFLASVFTLLRIIGRLNQKDTQRFGICPGSDGASASMKTDASLALTDWLHVRLNELAGRGPKDAPITVRELREDAEIHFKLVTSNLTLGQPYTLPLTRGSRSFFFKKSELVHLFPAPVIDALVSWGTLNRPTRSVRIRDEDAGDFLRFPMGEDMPLVVATRLSLSFPVLLSAVRLYSVKPDKYRKGSDGKPQTLDLTTDIEEHWLSDGGITSNFPIHVFDAWVPLRPTFGITLYDSPLTGVLDQREGHQREENPKDSVLLPHPRNFDQARPQRTAIHDVLGFLRAVFETAQSYRDNAQSGMPGYRERILQIFMDANEGGLNLDMAPPVIERIQAKGRCAADALLTRYESLDSVNFFEHRWVRMHVLMAELERQFVEVRGLFKGADWKDALLHRFDALFAAQLAAQESKATEWYRKKDAVWCTEARGRLEALLGLIETWDASQQAWRRAHPARHDEDRPFFFAENPPRPEGVLKVIPNP